MEGSGSCLFCRWTLMMYWIDLMRSLLHFIRASRRSWLSKAGNIVCRVKKCDCSPYRVLSSGKYGFLVFDYQSLWNVFLPGLSDWGMWHCCVKFLASASSWACCLRRATCAAMTLCRSEIGKLVQAYTFLGQVKFLKFIETNITTKFD